MSDTTPTESFLDGSRKAMSDDWLAIACALVLLLISSGAVWSAKRSLPVDSEAALVSPLKKWIGKPVEWTESPRDAFLSASDAVGSVDPWKSVVGTLVLLSVIFGIAMGIQNRNAMRFLPAFCAVFFLATLAYTLASQSVVTSYNLEYALWALAIGLIISNTIATPQWMRPAVCTEFYIKTGLVLLGAEVLMSRLWALGVPGVCVAWVVTPIVLISTYVFGQKVLKMESRSLNMVISADMSVCGVSAAIAAAAACKAKKEELSLAIGMSLSFTVVMMVVLPWLAKFMGLDSQVAGAWIGGTIDSTGAVAAASAALDDRAFEVAATVKMIQNILIGVSAFGIATYWVARIEKDPRGEQPAISEIWKRFPRFVLGFIGVSILFSLIFQFADSGPELVNATIKGSSKTLRGWCFCLAFISIGLQTRFRDLVPYLRGGKPLALYVCGQSLNILLTLAMSYAAFGILFKEATQ